MKNSTIPKMQEEVWAMKEDVYKDIKQMSVNEIFNYVKDKSNNFLKIEVKK